MKLLVLLVAVGVAFANICDNPDGLSGDIPALNTRINTFIANSDVLSYCPDAFNNVIANPSCKALYEEGFCYFNVGSKRYQDLSLDNVAADLSFELIAEGVPDAASYGQNLCDNARKCVVHAKAVGKKCMENPDFAIAIAGGAEDVVTKVKNQLQQLAAENPGTVIGRVSKMILDKIGDRDYAELKDAAMEYQDQYYDSKSKALDLGKEFCEKGCVAETAKALTNSKGTGLLDHLIRVPKCKRPAAFCDNCVGPAKTHFKKKGIPCCLKTVIDAGLKKFDYLQKKYGAKVDKFVEESTDAEQAIYFSVRKQLKCYRKSYDKIPKCMNA